MANPITPETRVHILSVPLENNMKATLYFANANAQETYFLSKAVKSNTDFTYQRKDKAMVVPYLVDDLYSCNYVMYQNHNFNNKWFYAFITKMEYVDEETTRLYIDTDPIQTWWFDITFKDSFIEREHVDDDRVGANLQPENIEIGETTINKSFVIPFHDEYIPCLAVTELPIDYNTPIDPAYPDAFKSYGDILSGLTYIIGGNSIEQQPTAEGVSNLIRNYDDRSKADAIVSIFMIPKRWAQGVTWKIGVDFGHPFSWAIIEGASDGVEVFYNKPTRIEDYVPRNKKLLTFPYVYFNLSNNAGIDTTFHYEDFQNPENNMTTYGFSLDTNICPSLSGKITPNYYKNRAQSEDDIPSYEYSIPLAKLPVCSWVSDVYTNYLTQNAIDIPLSFINGASLIALGASNLEDNKTLATGEMLGGANVIAKQISDIYKASLVPDQARGNTNTADINFTLGLCNPTIYEYTIKKQFAKIVDSYFDMFGYKCNLVKTPNYNHRRNWWYTKTIDCNIVGDIPEEDMERIKRCYNEGITFWKNPANMYDYSVDNSII